MCSTRANTLTGRNCGFQVYQVCWQADKVCVVLVEELNHGCFKQLIVELQVISKCFQLDSLQTVRHKVIDIKVFLKIKPEKNYCNNITFYTYKQKERKQQRNTILLIWKVNCCQDKAFYLFIFLKIYLFFYHFIFIIIFLIFLVFFFFQLEANYFTIL